MTKPVTQVWAIVDGDYSDYHVVGVFSSRANAQLVLDTIKAGEVVKWALDPAISELSQGLSPYTVLMLQDGTVERVVPNSPDGYNLTGSSEIWRRATAPYYKGTKTPDVLNATVWAKDLKHAVKIVNEKRLQLIAQDKW